MAYPGDIKTSNISENWLFQLGYYNGDAHGSGEGGWDAVLQSDGSANLIDNLGSELVQDGTDTNPADTNWTRRDSSGNADGWTEADPSAYEDDETASLINRLTGDGIDAGEGYSLTFTIVDGTATLRLLIGGANNATGTSNLPTETFIASTLYTIGTHTVYFIASADRGYLWFTAYTTSGGNGALDNIILKKSGYSASATTVVVDDGTVFEVGDHIKIDSEIIKITGISTNTLTVERGAKGTTAAWHNNNTALYWNNYLPLAFSDFTYDETFYYGVVLNKPSIRESIDLKSSTNKTSNISISIPDFDYRGDKISKELTGTHKYINRVADVYTSVNEGAATKIGSFRVHDISTDGYIINISLMSHRPWDNLSVPQDKTTSTQRYFPLVYGNFTGIASTYDDPAYIGTLPNTMFPVEVDRFSHFYYCLIHYDFASTGKRLRYYEKGFDKFIPVEQSHDAEAYQGGFVLKTEWHLKRHFKFKPDGAISKTFASFTNLTDGDVDHTSSNTGATLTMEETSSAIANTLNKDNIFDLPLFDDPPDITSTTDNHGFVIDVRWLMTGFYGETSNSSGLTVNNIQISNNSRYATGSVSSPDSINSGTDFATNGTVDKVNTATGSANSTSITETTSSTSGSATATEYSSYPYENGLSLRFQRNVTSASDGGGGYTSNIFSELAVYDVRCKVTCRIDRYNSSTDGWARVKSIDRLYSNHDGLLQGITGASSALAEEVHEAHLDLLNRFCGVDVATDPATDIDGWSALNSARGAFDIRWWIHKPRKLKSILEQMQFEGCFIFRFKQGDFNQPQYIHIANTPSTVLTLTKEDIDGISIHSSSPSDIVTKRDINYDVHPAKGTYQSAVTATNAASRKSYNIPVKENIEQSDLDMLVNGIGDTDPTNDDRNDSFAGYYNALFGGVFLMVNCNIINPAQWVDSSLNPIEVGAIIEFDENNMHPETPMGFNSGDWDGLKFIITDTVRSPGKLSIKARSV